MKTSTELMDGRFNPKLLLKTQCRMPFDEIFIRIKILEDDNFGRPTFY